MEALLRAARPPPRRPMWSVAECALFTARRDYELLRLVANDKKALQAARRLGFFRSHFQADPHPAATASGAAAATSSTDTGVAPAQPSGARAHRSRRAAPRARPDVGHPQPQPPQPAAAAGGAATAVVSSRDRPADGTSARAGNAKQRRSAARSARRHLQRRRCVRSRVLAVLFALRLRRRARLRRALQDVGELSDASSDGPSLAAKRGTGDRPPSSSSSGPDDSEPLDVVPHPKSSGCQQCHECSAELPEGRRLDVMAMLGCFTEGPLWVCRSCACTSYPDLVEFFPREARGERLKAPAKRGGMWRLGKR